MSGILSVTSTFSLKVTGDLELKHLDRLIRILRVQQQILAEGLGWVVRVWLWDTAIWVA